MNKREFALAGKTVQMETSTNDSLMVVCKEDFFVCDFCGYAVSSLSIQNDKNYSPFAVTFSKKHQSPWGKDCSGILRKKKL